MFLLRYELHELHFAYCYRVYLRCKTKRTRRLPPLSQLTTRTLNNLVNEYRIRVLECAASEIELAVIVSLQPDDTISSCSVKLKGRISKWLSQRLGLSEPIKLLSRGYFACTVGKSRRRVIERYLDIQGDHHGYASRQLPPVYVRNFEVTPAYEMRLSVPNAVVLARFHIVLSTFHRHGVIGFCEAKTIALEWQNRQVDLRIAILKVSFVPDHVHLALRAHPNISPAEIVVALMNIGQEIIEDDLARVGLDRLWEPSAYVGSYGDLASPQVRKYLERLRGE